MVTVTKVLKVPEKKVTFVDVYMDFDGGGVLIPDWKVSDGRLYGPSKKGGKMYFDAVIASPGLCKAVQQAIERLNDPEIELEPDAWVSAKWGKASLGRNTASAELMLELYNRHKGEAE